MPAAVPELARPTQPLPVQPAAPAGGMDAAAAGKLIADVRRVFRTGRTARLAWRQEQLHAGIRMTREHETDIMDALKKDTGKGRMDALLVDVGSTITDAGDLLKGLPKWTKPIKVSTNLLNLPARSEIRRDPLGVVLIIGPWNFPYLLCMQPMLGAIAAGNAVVLKPSEVAPATSALLADLIPKYFDPEAVRVVEGGAAETTFLLEQHWDAIQYTGGARVARIVAMAAAKHLTPTILELGGKNPTWVDSSANLDVTAKRLISSKCMNAGQICLAPDYLLVEKSIADELAAKLEATVKEFFGEDVATSPDFARIVNDRQFSRLAGYLEEPDVAKKIVFGGASKPEERFLEPTLLRDVPWDSAIAQEEIFGPFLLMQTVKNLDEAIALINERPKPLALYAFTKDKGTQARLLEETSSGGVCINDCVMHVSNPELPFGGVGESGHGAYHAKASFNAFSHEKSVMVKTFLPDPAARFPPATPWKERLMRAFLDQDFVRVILVVFGINKK